MGQQPPSDNRADGQPQSARARPQANGPGPVDRLGEDVGQDRECRGHDRRREDGQAADEDPLATQVVAEGARDEEQPREDQRVGVHDPLKLTRRRVQGPHDRGQGYVEDRGVQIGDEQCQAQHGQHEESPRAGVAGEGLPAVRAQFRAAQLVRDLGSHKLPGAGRHAGRRHSTGGRRSTSCMRSLEDGPICDRRNCCAYGSSSGVFRP